MLSNRNSGCLILGLFAGAISATAGDYERNPQIGVKLSDTDKAEVLRRSGKLDRSPIDMACKKAVDGYVQTGKFQPIRIDATIVEPIILPRPVPR